MLLDSLKTDITEMIDLAQRIENFDATVAASQALGKPIEPADAAHVERRRRGERLAELHIKWGV